MVASDVARKGRGLLGVVGFGVVSLSVVNIGRKGSWVHVSGVVAAVRAVVRRFATVGFAPVNAVDVGIDISRVGISCAVVGIDISRVGLGSTVTPVLLSATLFGIHLFGVDWGLLLLTTLFGFLRLFGPLFGFLGLLGTLFGFLLFGFLLFGFLLLRPLLHPLHPRER